MSEAFAWIGQLIEWFASLIPHLLVVRKTDRAIKFVKGHTVKVCEPGIHVYWPVVTDIQPVNVMRQKIDLEVQTLMTKDEKTVLVDGLIMFTIADVEKYLVDNYDAEESIVDVAMTALRKVVISSTLEDIQAGRAKIDNNLKTQTERLLEDFGVDVEFVRLKSFAPTRVFSLTGTGLTPYYQAE
tara:strand:- start:140 stop:691 length:552 start_codon:yes stop_codon:yes gene_type:complete